MFGLIGHPLKHSASRYLFNLFYPDLEYRFFDTADIASLFHGPDLNGAKGMNVTIPYKRDVLAYCDSLSREVAIIGSANVLHHRAGWCAYNSDAPAFFQDFTRKTAHQPVRRVMISGLGGIGRAVLFALLDSRVRQPPWLSATPPFIHRPEHIVLHTRQAADARRLAKGAAERYGCSIEVYPFTQQPPAGAVDAYINCTPLGMADYADSVPVSLAELQPRFVFDVVYNPLETPLLAAARRQGIACSNGLDMLLTQARFAYHIWQLPHARNVPGLRHKVEALCRPR